MKPFYHYLISDPHYYSNNPEYFKQTLHRSLQYNKVNMVCFRDKQSNNIEELAHCFLDVCQTFSIEHIFINQYLDLAIELPFTGIHLTSQQFHLIDQAKQHQLTTIISCHCEKELQHAIDSKADYVTYSPIFKSPNKTHIKGVSNLNTITKKFPIPIIALGGITTQNHIRQIQTTQAQGFASIRYFANNDNNY